MSERRPREHVLETLSVRKFESLIPPEWTSARVSDDYGVDLRVELFEKSGTGAATTGLEFGVQLKATDSETSRGTKVAVDWSHIEYWHSLSFPVLVVRYLAATDQAFGIWVHNRGERREKPDMKQAWFHFAPHHELGNWQGIQRETVAFRAARERNIRLPLSLIFSGPAATPELAARLNGQINSLLGPGVVTLLFDETIQSPQRVVLSQTQLTLNLGGGSATHVHELQQITGASPVPMAEDILLLLGLELWRSGSEIDSIRCLDSAGNSELLRHPEFIASLTGVSCQAGRADMALPAIERWSEATLDAGLLQIVRHAILREQPSERRSVSEDRLVRFVGASRDHSDGVESGIAHYNCANLFRSFNRHDEAISEYEAAAYRYPAYAQRSYFWLELAGSLFLLGKYVEAAVAYRQAIWMGDESARVRNLLADSLIGAGEYAAAVEVVDESSDGGGGILTAIVASQIVERFEIQQQQRRPEDAQRYLDDSAQMSFDPIALANLDALNPNCWIVQSPEGLGSEIEVAQRMIVAARVADSEPMLWAHALIFAFLAQLRADVLLAIVRRAHQQVGGVFVVEVAALLENSDISREAVQQLLALSQMLLEDNEDGTIVRDGRTGVDLAAD